MTDASALSSLSFFTVSRYHYLAHEICDFRDSPRPHFCMGYLTEGEADFEFDGKTVHVVPGEVIFVPVDSCYRSLWYGSPDVRYISMHYFFSARTPFPVNRQLEIQKISPSFPQEFQTDFEEAYDAFHAEEVAGQLCAIGCFFRVMSRLLPRLIFGEEQTLDERMLHAAAYLEQHYAERIPVDALAEICHLSPSHFHVLFKSTFGLTPIDYKNRICIRHAIIRLLRGSESVEQIRIDLGFESNSYFRRVFHRVTGCSPSEYARRNMGM